MNVDDQSAMDSETAQQAFRRRAEATFDSIRTVWQRIDLDADEIDLASRRRYAHLFVTACGLWQAIVDADGTDNGQPAGLDDQRVSMYDDDMVTYEMLDSIWLWNRLAHGASPDELDFEVTRAAVRILDLASRLMYWSDFRKRCEEAVATILVAHPQLLSTMREEAARLPHAGDLATRLDKLNEWADSSREDILRRFSPRG